ncbi:unnamed protein product [Fraxinus pennsylvanica]|uniref:Methyltransferase type 11 domain-containing protein n=1 Tax=Fraxinus pennsylvanica TaxID=56036 RepID=A0AAD1ZWP7_9LAMI|nr:unnamed protein product [Fraxinus pennsylvanica]
MGKKEQKLQKHNNSSTKQEELLKTLGDFTSKENWDQFFTIRGSDDSFEWYAEWPQLRDILKTHLLSSSPPPEPSDGIGGDTAHVTPEEVQILVPGCGNSKLSEHLYDLGFRNITNVDFSKVVISDMLRRNVRDRPEMKWRVMDITSMQFVDESFDAILDKGGLDALMEPKLGPRLGNEYLSEVKRVLKVGGKFICLTLAESHVLELLFPKFRFGWKLSLHAIPLQPSRNHRPQLQTFMVIAEKDNSTVVAQVSSFIDPSSIEYSGNQAREFFKAVERENEVRTEYSQGSDIYHSLEDLKLGSKGNLEELNPGRRVQLTLGEPGLSRFSYKAVLLDAQKDSGPFTYHCGVFLVPKTRAREWLFSSEEGQWLVVESSKAARLVMILLDSSNSNGSMDDIQKDLSPLVKQLAPGDCDNGAQIPFMAASDGIKQRRIVHKATSTLTGSIIVDDVIYEKLGDDLSRRIPFNDVMFRRLMFQRRLLPNFLHKCLPFLEIEVVELDPVVLDVARDYFGFEEDKHLKVHITDGIKFVREMANFETVDVSTSDKNDTDNGSFSNGSSTEVHADGRSSNKIDVLIIDVDSSDLSSGLTCPASDFVEESFLSTVKNSLSEQGLFVINLVSRSLAVKDKVFSRLQTVFSNIFSLQLEEDLNEVIFALKDSPIEENQFSEACDVLARLLELEKPEWSRSIIDGTKLIKRLR